MVWIGVGVGVGVGVVVVVAVAVGVGVVVVVAVVVVMSADSKTPRTDKIKHSLAGYNEAIRLCEQLEAEIAVLRETGISNSDWTERIDAIEPGEESEDYEADCREAIRLCRELAAELAAANARLDWLERHQMVVWSEYKLQRLTDEFGLREAIDEAMKGTTT